jgi:hypothetical protein
VVYVEEDDYVTLQLNGRQFSPPSPPLSSTLSTDLGLGLASLTTLR